jgi:hypothetical protein
MLTICDFWVGKEKLNKIYLLRVTGYGLPSLRTVKPVTRNPQPITRNS